MLNRVFYYSLISKYVAIFGNLFNDIKITRKDSLGNRSEVIVPINYAARAKWLIQEESKQSGKEGFLPLTYPRLSFEIKGIEYDPSRQSDNLSKSVRVVDGKLMKTQLRGVPYKISFTLAILSNSSDDSAQVIEQILPYFTPSITQRVLLVPEMDIYMDIPIKMTSQSFEDNYEGDMAERRIIRWTLDFDMEVYFYGPIEQNGPIKRVQVDLMVLGGADPILDSDATLKEGRDERVVITPGLTVDRKPTHKKADSIDFQLIEADDPYGFVTEYFTYDDEKVYNPHKGIDE